MVSVQSPNERTDPERLEIYASQAIGGQLLKM